MTTGHLALTKSPLDWRGLGAQLMPSLARRPSDWRQAVAPAGGTLFQVSRRPAVIQQSRTSIRGLKVYHQPSSLCLDALQTRSHHPLSALLNVYRYVIIYVYFTKSESPVAARRRQDPTLKRPNPHPAAGTSCRAAGVPLSRTSQQLHCRRPALSSDTAVRRAQTRSRYHHVARLSTCPYYAL